MIVTRRRYSQGYDNLLGLGKKAKARKAAKKEAKAAGASGKEARQAGRAAVKEFKAVKKDTRQAIKSVRKEAKAMGLKGKEKRKLVQVAQADRQIKLGQAIGTQKAISKGEKRAGKIIAREGKSAIGATIEDVGYAVLTPFKPFMKSALRKQGLLPPSNTEDLAEMFYNKIVAGNHYDSAYTPYNFDSMPAYQHDNIVGDIVDAIINFIRGVKAKGDSGEPLGKVEEIIYAGANKVEGQLNKAAKQEAATQLGERLLFDNKTIMIIGGVFVAIIVVFFVAGRGSK